MSRRISGGVVRQCVDDCVHVMEPAAQSDAVPDARFGAACGARRCPLMPVRKGTEKGPALGQASGAEGATASELGKHWSG
jgi:hypothetical protein